MIRPLSAKPKILFVDDEAFLLRGLQRVLRPMTQEWEMAFVESGAQALEQMAKTPFDVVVSDLQMPGMNGIELVNQILKQYPKTIRFLLASHADLGSIYKSVGLMHHFLLKPCDEKELRAAVTNALNRENSALGENLRKLLPKIRQLPSMPTLYVELVQMIGDPNVGIDDIGAVIARDMSMTAMVLRLVNSAYFGLRHRVSSVTDAAKYMGVETLRSLVLSSKVFSQYNNMQIGSFSAEGLWKHSMECAIAAKSTARMEGAGQKMSDEAFVAGILHDIGKLVLSVNFKDSYKEVVKMVDQKHLSYHEAEQAVFGANHADVGAHILSYWGLPSPIVEAIGFHHAPASSGNMIFGPLTVVHSANAILNHRYEKGEVIESALDKEYLEELGLMDRLAVWRSALSNEKVEEVHKPVKPLKTRQKSSAAKAVKP